MHAASCNAFVRLHCNEQDLAAYTAAAAKRSMAMCRAQCLRPFVSLREFGAVACRRSVVRRPLLCSRATFSASAAAAASAAPAAPAPKYASLPAEQQRQVGVQAVADGPVTSCRTQLQRQRATKS